MRKGGPAGTWSREVRAAIARRSQVANEASDPPSRERISLSRASEAGDRPNREPNGRPFVPHASEASDRPNRERSERATFPFSLTRAKRAT